MDIHFALKTTLSLIGSTYVVVLTLIDLKKGKYDEKLMMLRIIALILVAILTK